MKNSFKVLQKIASMFVVALIIQSLFVFTLYAKDYSIDVLDTINGSETYFSVKGLDEYEVRLLSPDGELIFLDNSDSHKIQKKFLDSPGEYTLYLYTSMNGSNQVVVAMDTFDVKQKYLDPRLLSASIFAIGGDELSAGDRFQLLSIPEEVNVGENFNFTVRALDDTQVEDPNYLGTVHFEVDTDSEAILPVDYTFLDTDSGAHVFSGEASLRTPGDHLFKVTDVADSTLMGQISIKVIANEDTSKTIKTGDMTISSPLAGETSENIINFSGTADPGLEVKIFANDDLITFGNVDSEGSFDLDSPVLPDGDYVFQLKTNTAESELIEIKIDASAKILSGFTFSNESPSLGEEFDLNIALSDSISSAKVLLDEVYIDLGSTDLILDKAFAGKLIAPSIAGTYPIDLIITMTDGREIVLEDLAILEIEDSSSHGSADDNGDASGNDDTELLETFFVPSQVTGVQATPSDKSVTLSWIASQDNTGVDHYLIKYGNDRNNLALSVETQSSDTIWFVSELDNGTEYYFAVYGVDTEGNKSDVASLLISAIPGAVGSTTLHGSAGDQVLVDSTSETGPGNLLYLFLFSASIAYTFRTKLSSQA